MLESTIPFTTFFSDLLSRPRWLAAYGLSVLLVWITDVVTTPLEAQNAVRSAWPSLSREAAAALVRTICTMQVARGVSAPIVVIIGAMSMACLVWIILKSRSVNVEYRSVLCVVCYSSIPNYLDRLLGSILLYTPAGNGRARTAAEMMPHTVSVADIVYVSNSFMSGAFQSVTLFYIWSVVLLSYGVAGIDRDKSRIVTIESVALSQIIVLCFWASVRKAFELL